MSETPPSEQTPPSEPSPSKPPAEPSAPEPVAEGGEPTPYRLDPEVALARAGAPKRTVPEPIIDTRRYRWMIGIFGLVLLVAFSVYMFTSHGIQTTGVPAGKRLPLFVAPLAGSGLTGAANANPRCDPAHPNPKALNVCGRTPVVLGLFVTGSGECQRQVDTIEAVARQFRASQIQFAALAVDASAARTESLVRSHHWTIPIAYDPDGRVGELYGVSICPMVELAYRGGVVADRLVGNHWLSAPALAARVHRLLARRR